MSSPTLIHPTGANLNKSEVSERENTTTTTKGSLQPLGENNVTNKRAWQEGGSKSLGRTVGLQVSSFTGGFSSEEDSDSDCDLNTSRGKTRSLGRKEMNCVMSASDFQTNKPSNVTSVSARSTAYKELIDLSQNFKKLTPRHSALKLGDGSDTSPVQRRIEMNPFLQLDKQGKIQPVRPAVFEQRRKTTPAHLKTTPAHLNADTKTKGASNSPTITGMSVQMRIKIWAEKEHETKESHEKLAHRRSLQATSFLVVNSVKKEMEVGENEEEAECTAHSDDETVKKKSIAKLEESYTRAVHDNNVYAEIDDKAVRHRIDEASSSSSDSVSPNKSPKSKSKKKREKKGSPKKGSPKAAKKNSKVDSPDLNQKRSKWKIKSPLTKRKKKVKKLSKEENLSPVIVGEVIASEPVESGAVTSEGIMSEGVITSGAVTSGAVTSGAVTSEVVASEVVASESPVPDGIPSRTQRSSYNRKAVTAGKSRDEDEVIDEVFNPYHEDGSSDSKRQSIEPPSVDSPPHPHPTRESRSISREILSIIDSLGTINESLPPADSSVSISVLENNSAGDSGSGSEEAEDGVQSSLDVKSIARLALKRRASDGHRAQHEVNHSDNRGRKGSAPAIEQNVDSLIATALMYADAVWDREALDDDELSFRVSDVIEILDMTDDVWWHGSVGNSSGWFPASFVRLRVGQDSDSDEGDSGEVNTKLRVVSDPPAPDTRRPSSNTSTADSLAVDQLQRLSNPTPALDPPSSSSPVEEDSDKSAATLPRNFPRQQGNTTTRRRMTIRRKDPSSSSLPQRLTPEQVRAKIIEEILSTERDYVKHLEDIIEGYLKRCLEYNALFGKEQIEVIFSNVNKIFDFQKDFLRELEARIKPGRMAESEIGEVFVLNQHEFKVYSQYCNNHPYAVSEMSCLQENEQYCFFFESCRLLRNLQDISLEGFLLTPVQKICKYPLQLSELLKYTSEDHPDHAHVVAAQKAMKEVAMLINEQKRRIENIGKIGCWQKNIEGWKGPDVLETSTEMVQSGELHKISKGHSQERHFFLFDHQMVYCKKDTIGGKLSYKGRVDLDHCQIADITDSSVLHGNTPVKNCWRMNNKAKDNKWYIIYAKSPQVKEEWMKAFERERERVREDEEKGFHVSMKMKRAAVALCASDMDPRQRGKNVKKHVAFSESVDGSAGNRKLAMTMSGTGSSSQAMKKAKTARRKLNSVSGTSSAKVIF